MHHPNSDPTKARKDLWWTIIVSLEKKAWVGIKSHPGLLMNNQKKIIYNTCLIVGISLVSEILMAIKRDPTTQPFQRFVSSLIIWTAGVPAILMLVLSFFSLLHGEKITKGTLVRSYINGQRLYLALNILGFVILLIKFFTKSL